MRYFILISFNFLALIAYAQPVPYYSYFSAYSASMRRYQKDLDIQADKNRQPNAKSNVNFAISPEAIANLKSSWAQLKTWNDAPAAGTPGGSFTEEQIKEFKETAQKRLNEQYYVNSLLDLYNTPLNSLLPKITAGFTCQSGECIEGLGYTTINKDIEVSANYKNGKKNGIASFYINDPIISQLNATYENDLLLGKATLIYKDESYQNVYFNADMLVGNAIIFFDNKESIVFNRNRGVISGLVTHWYYNSSYSKLIYTDGNLLTMLKANTINDLIYPSPGMYSGNYHLTIGEENFSKTFDDKSGAFSNHYTMSDGRRKYLHLFPSGHLETSIYEKDGAGLASSINYFPNGNIAEYEIKKGKRTDNATMYYANGAVYTGGFSIGQPYGKGKMVWPNKDYFIGKFGFKGQKEEGQIFYSNGVLFYEGKFKDDLKSGKGKAFYAESGVTYEGEWSNDMFNGKGKITKKNGYYKTAEFKDFIESNVAYFSPNGAKITASEFNSSM